MVTWTVSEGPEKKYPSPFVWPSPCPIIQETKGALLSPENSYGAMKESFRKWFKGVEEKIAGCVQTFLSPQEDPRASC